MASAAPHPLPPPTCACAHSMRSNNQIVHGDQTRCEANFTRSTTNADARYVCGRKPSCYTRCIRSRGVGRAVTVVCVSMSATVSQQQIVYGFQTRPAVCCAFRDKGSDIKVTGRRDVGLETWSWSRDRSRPLF